MHAAADAAVRHPPDQPKMLCATAGNALLTAASGGGAGGAGVGGGGRRALCTALKPYTRGSSAA
jgi:hypothetical protein